MAIMDRSMEGKRQYTTGISKGVFFGEDGKAFPWNGLISVTEKPQANAPTPVYNSLGEKYDQFGNIAEKKHSLTCYTYPEEMDEFLGIEYLEAMGYSVDERPPKKFSMAYRTELGDGLYEIHVLLNQIATFADTAKNTITNNITPTVVTMNLEGVPDPRIKSSHIILDSRLPLTESAERLLFGNNMVDGNINEFLDAEPTWVTVATNYAPIIEPDYDNMVWLGGENLLERSGGEVVEGRSYYNPQVVTIDGLKALAFNSSENIIYLNGSDAGLIEEGSTLTFSFLAKASSPISLNRISIGGGTVYINTTVTTDWQHFSTTYTVTRDFTPGIHLYPVIKNEDGTYETFYITNWKLEYGAVATPWTPSVRDNNVLDPNKPRPSNYVPGVKGGITGVSAIGFYDEKNKGLGVYSRSITAMSSRLIPRTIPVSELLGSRVSVKSEVVIDEPVSGPTVNFARIAVSQGPGSAYTNMPPNVRGVHHVSGSTDNMTALNNGYEHVIFYHGGIAGGGTITYRKTMVSTDPDLDFFDVNSTPPTKGDRYIRVPGGSADYTEHQQLMLQSKSRVILSDITPNQYTLEASDSQLRVDGQTFTFKGPQATPIGDDQFTIDDTVYGED